jgi:glutathione S-transferase
MAAKLYVVNGSHPCVTVAEALRRKGIAFKTVEFPPPAHALGTRLAGFPGRTVPAIKFDDGEKLQGSRAILARLEELVPDPPLFGTSPEERTRIEEAERWGDDVLQALVRRVLWPAAAKRPKALYDFQAGSKLPKLPLPVIKANLPVIVALERRMNDATDENLRRDLAELPAHLDKVDAWLADGTLGGEQQNAADLQIAPSLRLLHAVEDVRPYFEGRPAQAYMHQFLDPLPASVAAGALPAELITA